MNKTQHDNLGGKQDPSRRRSIHPRVMLGRGVLPKRNTCAKKRPITTARKVAALQEHLSRHPGDMQSNGHLAKLLGKD